MRPGVGMGLCRRRTGPTDRDYTDRAQDDHWPAMPRAIPGGERVVSAEEVFQLRFPHPDLTKALSIGPGWMLLAQAHAVVAWTR